MNEFSVLIKERLERSLALFLTGEGTGEASSPESGSRFSSELTMWQLDLALKVSKMLRNKFFLCLLHPVYVNGILLSNPD